MPIDLGRSPAAKPVRAVVMTQKPAPSAGGLSGPGEGKPGLREKMRPPIPREYRIKAGDTLGHIAQRFYGRAREHAAIVKANPGIDPLRLQVGQVIRLPRRMTADVVKRAAAPGAPGAADRLKTDGPRGGAGVQRRVVVRSGDSLYRIAERAYGDGGRWREIYEANREVIDDPAMIQIGMALMVPKRGAEQVDRGR